MLDRIQFTTAVSCPGCGNVGETKWEENSQPKPSGLGRAFLGVSPGFRHELQQQQKSRDPIFYCEKCGTKLAD